MAYRNPRYYMHHAFRTAGVSALAGSSFDASFPSSRLLDSSVQRNAKFAGTTANQFVRCDRGSGFASLPQCDSLIIPAGHNFGGTQIEIHQDTVDITVGTGGSLAFAGFPAAGEFLGSAFTVSDRYIALNVPASGTAWELGELWLTQQRTTTSGIDPGWKDTPARTNYLENVLEAGERYRLGLGAGRRELDMTYRGLNSTDAQVFRDLITETQGCVLPFYMTPPNDTEKPILVHFLDELVLEQDHAIPGNAVTGPTYTVRVHVAESLA